MDIVLVGGNTHSNEWATWCITRFSIENTWHVQLFIGIQQIATKIFC